MISGTCEATCASTPRFNLWNYLGAACGVNLPLLCYADLLGRPQAAGAGYLTGVRWLALDNDLRAFVRDYRGDLSLLGYLRSLAGPKVYNEFSWSDPVPAVVSTARYLGALSRRLRRELVS